MRWKRVASRGTAGFLLLVVLAGVCSGQTITKIQMDVKAEGWGSGHSTPSFSADTASAYCRVEVEIPPQGASLSYTLTLTWYAPDGTVYQTNSWDLTRDAYYYTTYQRVGVLAIRGTRAATLLGQWRVTAAIRFGKARKDVRFEITPAGGTGASQGPRGSTPSPTPTARAPLPAGAGWPDVIAWARPAVVFIQGETAERDEEGNKLYSFGSGVIISADGYILTAAHVIADVVGEIEVLVGESQVYTATVVKTHSKWDPEEFLSGDVALLKIPASGLAWLPLGASEELMPEEEIRVLGYPRAGLGLGMIPAAGKALGIRRLPSGVHYVQIEVTMYDKGHSGGPVINSRGQVVGIAKGTSTFSDTGITHQLAVATATIKEIVPSHLLGLVLPMLLATNPTH
ncbi:trypsin-like peptidase domain-containing protein [Candidatus Bipolaricaulota bacterium]|nr:trypsin-like peptidase domain-containing protein [Candidatus Bipolaricaulota bacterium]